MAPTMMEAVRPTKGKREDAPDEHQDHSRRSHPTFSNYYFFGQIVMRKCEVTHKRAKEIVEEARQTVQPRESAAWQREWEDECLRIHEAVMEAKAKELAEKEASKMRIKPQLVARGQRPAVTWVPFEMLKDDYATDSDDDAMPSPAINESGVEVLPDEWLKKKTKRMVLDEAAKKARREARWLRKKQRAGSASNEEKQFSGNDASGEMHLQV